MPSDHEFEEEYEVGEHCRHSLPSSHWCTKMFSLFTTEYIIKARVENVKGEGGSKVKEWVREITAKSCNR